MTISLKAIVLGFGIAVGTATVAQPAQQPQARGPMPQMNQAMGQMRPMMNDAQMRTQMSQMSQSCQRMMSSMSNMSNMSNMGGRVQQAPSNRR